MSKDRIFLVSGILLLVGAAWVGLNFNFLYVFGVAATVGVILIIVSMKNYPSTRSENNFSLRISPALILLFLFSLIFGNFYYHFYFNLKATNEFLPQSGEKFIGIINVEPSRTEKAQQFTISFESPYKGEIKVTAPPFPSYQYGDELSIAGAVQNPDDISRSVEIVFPKIELVSEHKGFWLREKLISIKNSFLAQFPKFLPREESALMSGILLGDKSGFDKALKDEMSAAGVTHIVALSGYNVTIIVWVIAGIFGNFFSRRKTFYFTLIFIALFALMCGAEASLIRAAIMGFLVLLAKELGRIYAKANSLVFTALLMTLQNPSVLVADAGFQLSFLSLMGIFYLLPAIKSAFRIDEKRSGGLDLKEVALTTLAAQLAVMPITILLFSKFSLLAIIPNILILELMPFTMLLGALLGLVGFISYYLGFFLGEIAHIVLAYELLVIKLFAAIQLPAPSELGGGLALVCYYAVTILFIWIFAFRKPDKNFK